MDFWMYIIVILYVKYILLKPIHFHIPYLLNSKYPDHYAQGYGAFIDLKGNIIHLFQYFFAIKGSDLFNAKKINKYATNLIVILYQTFKTNEETDINTTNVTGLYAYFTNITDNNFPLYI